MAEPRPTRSIVSTITVLLSLLILACAIGSAEADFTLTTSIVSGFGTIQRNPNQTSYAPGTSVTLTATPSTGYAFTGWSGSVTTTTNPVTIVMNDNMTVSASFVGYVLATQVLPSGSGSVSRSPFQVAYAPGSTVTLQAIPFSGYAFSGWSGDTTGTTNPLTFAVSRSMTIRANFTGYPVSVSVNPSGFGSVTASPSQAGYQPGSTVTLTAIPQAGITFSSWSGSVTSTDNPVTVTVNAPLSITANFSVGAPTCGGWTPVTGAAPSKREYPSAAFDPIRARTILFGGSNLNDLWELPSGAAGWSPVSVQAGTLPQARARSVLVYDSRRDRMLLTGGSSFGSYLNDLWHLSLAGTPQWTQIMTSGTPYAAAYGFSAVYDSIGDRLIVFGGRNATTTLNQLYALDLSAATPTWSPLAAAGTGPSARANCAAFYDPVGNRVIVFGGESGNQFNQYYGDLWSLDLNGTPEWHPLAAAGDAPYRRAHAGFAYDPARERALLFGGYVPQNWFQDTWVLSLKHGPAWVQLTPHGVVPTARYEHATAFDISANELIVTCGYIPVTGPINSTGALYFGDGMQLDLATDPPATGTVTRDVARSCYTDGEQVTLTATPASGYVFSGWTGDVGGLANPATTTMDDDKAVVAHFAPAPVGVADGARIVTSGITRLEPNPSQGQMQVGFAVARAGRAHLQVVDIAGRIVATLADGNRVPGRYSATWDGRTTAGPAKAGVYFLRLTTADRTSTKRLALIR